MSTERPDDTEQIAAGDAAEFVYALCEGFKVDTGSEDDAAKQARNFEQFLYTVEDLAAANHNVQKREDIKLARALGIPEPVIQSEVRRLDIEYATAQECSLQHMRSNRHRDLWRSFKQRYLNDHALCELCASQGKRSITTELRPLIVHAGNPHTTFDRKWWQPLCSLHYRNLGLYKPVTDGWTL